MFQAKVPKGWLKTVSAVDVQWMEMELGKGNRLWYYAPPLPITPPQAKPKVT